MIKVKNHAFQIYSLTFRLKTLREVAFLTDSGNWFHNLGVEEENGRSNIAVFNLGSAREPYVDDFSVRLSNCEIGVSEKYSCLYLLYDYKHFFVESSQNLMIWLFFYIVL